MSLYHILCFVSIFVLPNVAEIVLPSINDTSFEYYIANTTEEFENQQIICNTDICIIKCNQYGSCRNTTIDASNSQNLSIICPESYSCYSLNVISGPQQPSSIANIQCSDTYSCNSANFNLQNAENISISCENVPSSTTNSAACRNMLVNASNVDTVDIECKSAYSCYSAEWDLSSVTSANIDCYSTTGCYLVSSIGTPKDIICPAGVDCVLQCESEWVSIGCKKGTIDATQATSLHITCPSNYYCSHTNIICPTNGDCNVQCQGQYSCNLAVINGKNSNSLNVGCNNDPYTTDDSYSCFYTDIVCPANGNECSVQCLGGNACDHIDIEAINTGNISLICDAEESCDYAHIIANDTNNILLTCLDDLACRYIDFDSYSNANISILAYGYRAIYSGHYIMNSAKYVYIECDHPYKGYSSSTYAGCYTADFTFDHTKAITLSCVDKYDCYSLDLYGYKSNSVQIHCKDSYSCSYGNFYCGAQYDNQCNIKCYNSYSCNGMSIINNNTDYVNEFLDIMCLSDSGCTGSSITSYCNNKDKYYDNSGLYVYNSSVISYSSLTDAFECDDRDCCPIQRTIECDPNIDCIVDCGNTTCYNAFVNGQNAASLTVICASNQISGGACYNTEINCPSMNGDCNIYCNDTNKDACFSMLISHEGNTNSNTDLHLYCNGRYSCQTLTIDTPYIKSAVIDCINDDLVTSYSYGSCYSSIWYLNNTELVNVTCSKYGCNYVDIYAMKSKMINVECSQYYSCNQFDLDAPSSKHSLSINCSAEFNHSCNNINIKVDDDHELEFVDFSCPNGECDNIQIDCAMSRETTLILPKSTNNGYVYKVCDNYGGCCPYLPPNITCTDINSCDFDCGQVSVECESTLLIAIDSQPMTVNCMENEACKGTIVDCPANSDCIISCIGYSSCENMLIYAEDNTNLKLNCSNTKACSDMNIDAEQANNLYIECDGTGGSLSESNAPCGDMDIDANYVKNTIYMSCKTNDIHTYTCINVTLDAVNANKLILDNFGTSANVNAYIFANYSSNMTVACRSAYGTAKDRYSYDIGYSCDNTVFAGGESNKLICEGFGCGKIAISAVGGLDDWEFNRNGCGQCVNQGICTDTIKIYCERELNDTYTWVLGDTWYSGSSSSSGYVSCECCGDDRYKISDSYYNDFDSCLINEGIEIPTVPSSGFSVFVCVISFMFIVIPIVGYAICRGIKKEETNKPTIFILIYVLFAYALIFIANWNLFVRALALYNTYKPHCSEKAPLICNADEYCKAYDGKYVDDDDVDFYCDDDYDDCECRADQPFEAYYITMAVFCSIGSFIELIRLYVTIVSDTKDYSDNIDDSLLGHLSFMIMHPSTTRRILIEEKYNIRQYWDLEKNWSAIATFLLFYLPVWITAMVANATYDEIEWYAIYPVIILFFVVILIKIRYRIQPADKLPIKPTAVSPVEANDNDNDNGNDNGTTTKSVTPSDIPGNDATLVQPPYIGTTAGQPAYNINGGNNSSTISMQPLSMQQPSAPPQIEPVASIGSVPHQQGQYVGSMYQPSAPSQAEMVMVTLPDGRMVMAKVIAPVASIVAAQPVNIAPPSVPVYGADDAPPGVNQPGLNQQEGGETYR